MQIKIYKEHSEEREDNLAYYIEDKLEMSSYDSGELETMRDQIRNIATTFSKLLEKLVEKKVIILKDVSKFLNTSDFLEKGEAE